jgi:two-component system, cell cycle response regulator
MNDVVKGSVLVVDDDDATRLLVTRWLAKEGFAVLEVNSGAAALSLIAAQGFDAFDCIVLDVMMPGLTGVDVLQKLKEEAQKAGSLEVPVLMLTAHATDDTDVVAAIDSGASDYVFKPFSGPVLVARVKVLVKKTQAARAMRAQTKVAEEGATIDPLTALFNRRHLTQALTEESARSRRHKTPCAVILYDLDHFKKLNDTHGHTEGDRALKYFGAQLLESRRGEDRVFRYGGEEFLSLLPNTDSIGAEVVTVRLRASLVQLPFVMSSGVTLPIDFSAGIATFRPDSGRSIAETMEDADKALYKVKREGRGRARRKTEV